MEISTILEEDLYNDVEIQRDPHDISSLFSLENLGLYEAEADLFSASEEHEIVSSRRFVLDQRGNASFTEDRYLAYKDQSHLSKDPFNLFDERITPTKKAPPIIRKEDLQLNTHGASTPLMPNARFNLENVEREFHEPIRDREKDFVVEQNEILCSNDPAQDRTREEMKKMGKYQFDANIPPNYWSPQFQSLIRKTKMFRTTKYISETYCVIDVFGIGISGRVSGSGARMIILEAYSTWNSHKHVLVLTVPQLRQMFAGHEELFLPGRKRELVDRIIHFLYFTYTIEPATLSEDELESIDSELKEDVKHSNNQELESRVVDEADAPVEQELPKLNHREKRLLEREQRSQDPIYQGLILPGDKSRQDSKHDSETLNERKFSDRMAKIRRKAKMIAAAAAGGESFEHMNLKEKDVKEEKDVVKKNSSWGFGNLLPSFGIKDSFQNNARSEVSELTQVDNEILQKEDKPRAKPDNAKSAESRNASRKSVRGEIADLLPQPYLATQVVEDLDEPKQIRPDLLDYPLTVAEIMRYKRDLHLVEEHALAWKGYALPSLTQELKVGSTSRKSAAQLREVKEAIRLRKIEEAEATKKAAWLAIPPMKRGFVMNKFLRDKGRMVLLRTYRYPHKPNNIIIKGHVLDECKNLQLNLALSSIGNYYGEFRPPKDWPEEYAPELIKTVIGEVGISLTGDDIRDGQACLQCMDIIAFESQLKPMQCIKIQKKFLAKRATTVDNRSLAWDYNEVLEYPKETRMYFRDILPPLSKKEIRENAKRGGPPRKHPLPFRHWGTKRMFTTCGLIGGIDCVYSLNWTCKKIPGPEIPEPPKKVLKVLKVLDKQAKAAASRLEGERDLWLKMKTEENKRVRHLAALQEKEKRDKLQKEREAMYQHLEDRGHELSHDEFRKKYYHTFKLSNTEFKEMWGMEKFGIWHYTYLHKLNVKFDEERRNHILRMKQEEAEEREHEEQQAKQHKHRHKKKKQAAKKKHRHHLLHAVEIKEGEDHETFMMRRMKEAIQLKKSQGLEVDVTDSDEERRIELEKDVVVFSEYHTSHDNAQAQVKEDPVEEEVKDQNEEDSDSEDDDWINEGSAQTKESLANEWLDAYCRDFEVELEMYFPHSQTILGTEIPAQSFMRRRIRAEDIIRVIPLYEDAFKHLRIAYQAWWDQADANDVEDIFHEWQFEVMPYLFKLECQWAVLSPSELSLRRSLEEKRLKTPVAEEEAPAVNPLALAEDDKEVPVERSKQESNNITQVVPNEAAVVDSKDTKDTKDTKEENDGSENESDAGSFFESASEGGLNNEDGSDVEEEKPVEPEKVPKSQLEQFMARQRLFHVHAQVPGVGEAVKGDIDDTMKMKIDVLKIDSLDGDKSDSKNLSDSKTIVSNIDKSSVKKESPIVKQTDISPSESETTKKAVEKNQSDAKIIAPQEVKTCDFDRFEEKREEAKREKDCTATKVRLQNSPDSDSASVAVLTWPLPYRSKTPTIIYRRPIKIRNSNPLPFKQTLLLIELLIQGDEKLTIYAWDIRQNNNMYTLVPDADYQKAQASALQYMSLIERRTNIDIFLQNDLSFGMKMCQNGEERLLLTIDQDFEVQYSEDEDEEAIDYEAMAAAQLAETNAKLEAKKEKMEAVKDKLAVENEEKKAEEKKMKIQATRDKLAEAKARSRKEMEDDRQIEAEEAASLAGSISSLGTADTKN